MVDITPLVPAGRQIIQSYGEGGFRIAGTHHRGSVLVLPERTIAWSVAEAAAITAQSLAPLIVPEEGVRVLLIGCGVRIAPVGAGLRAALRARGIGAEIMDTGAACRTFNVLLGEDRAVAAALIAVE